MKLWALIYTVHPINNIYVPIYMQYIPRIMKANTRLHHGIQCNEMECGCLGLSVFWFVEFLVCRRFDLSTFRLVNVLVCRRFGRSTFWLVDILVCRRFGCRLSVSRRFDQSTVEWLHIMSSSFLISLSLSLYHYYQQQQHNYRYHPCNYHIMSS